MRKSINIVPTLTVMDSDLEYESMVNNFVASNSTTFRCNATRFSNEIYYESLNKLQKIHKEKTNKNFKLLLDIPCPKDKTRLVFADKKNEVNVLKDDKILIANDKNLINEKLRDERLSVYVSMDLEKVNIGDKVIVGDGDVVLKIIEKQRNYLLCKCLNCGVVGYRKAIYVNSNYCVEVLNKDLNRYLELIEMTKPEFVALSFIESREDMLKMKELIKNRVSNIIQIIAKIESPKAIENIEGIANECDMLLIGRGDLALSGEYGNLYMYQNKVLNYCLDRKKEVLVATDILNSLVEKEFPSRAEICDVARLIEMGCKNFVFSGPLCRYQKYNVAVGYLDMISRSLEC